MSIVQKEFIRRVLANEAKRLEKNQGLQMKKLLHFRTGQLFNDRTFKVEDAGSFGGKIIFRHKNYQRFLDIKKRNGKRYQIHNQFVMGHYASIASRLGYELTEDVVAGIKKDLKIPDNG